MAIEPEFVRLIKRWVRPTLTEEEQKKAAAGTSTSGVKPMQLDDADDLR